jgi:phosphatidylglycerophosphatase A
MSRARSRTARVLATWFGCGLIPRAPGTAGTLGAIPLYLLASLGGPWVVAVVAAVVTAIGVWAAAVVERELGTGKDPQIIVIDEVAGLLVTMIPVAPSWRTLLLGFALFRLLDTLKPWPIRRFEALPSGWGIVFDDVAAGVVGALVMLALHAAKIAV